MEHILKRFFYYGFLALFLCMGCGIKTATQSPYDYQFYKMGTDNFQKSSINEKPVGLGAWFQQTLESQEEENHK